MSRRFDHIDLRVRSMEEAREFYETVLPALGFTRNDSNERWLEFEYVDANKVTDYFAVTESTTHQPNETRIAFWAASRFEVDRLAKIVRLAGGRNIEGPGFETDHYYAVFFEDPSGNRFEICYRTMN